jgi:hypothetical protein
MSPVIILVTIAAVPLILAFMLRVNAIFLFLSVAAGGIIAGQWGTDANVLIDGFSSYQHSAVVANLALLLIPVALTLFLLRKTLPTPLFIVQGLPLVATCVTLAIFVINYLPDDVQRELYSGEIGSNVKTAQDIIVAGTAVLVLLLMWLTYRHKPAHGKKHKK